MERKTSTKYIQERYRAKYKKFQQLEGKEYTYKAKEEKLGDKTVKKIEKSEKTAICVGCGKIYTNR